MWGFLLLNATEVPFYIRLIDASIALAVAMGIGIPLWNFQRKQIEIKDKALEDAYKQNQSTSIENLKAIKEITTVLSNFQSQSVSNDTEHRLILRELNNSMSRLSIVMETIIKFKGE